MDPLRGKGDQKISAKMEAAGEHLRTYTRLNGPVAELGFLEQSLLFAELSRLSYFSRGEAGRAANEIGFPEIRFYDRDGAQAYIFGNDVDAVVTCRGTEPNEWNDIRADLNALTDLAETAGRVHRGFNREVNDLWPRLEKALVSNERTLWFTGHSLGGAMSAICAGRCKLSHIKSDPEGLFTYGSPRVGNRRYVNYVRLNYYRWVNNNDIVPRVPPTWFGYRHAGQELYLNRNGQLSAAHGYLRFRDRWWGFFRTLRRWRIDHFSDHLMGEYITAIKGLVDQQRGERERCEAERGEGPNPPHQAAATAKPRGVGAAAG